MPSVVCLHGGGELTESCRALDTVIFDRVPAGPAVVLPVAAAPGAAYERLGRLAADYLAALGVDARLAPDPREVPHGLFAVLAGATVLLLPGGAPSRVRAALALGIGVSGPGATAEGATTVGEVLAGFAAAGGLVYGASAGGMLLCEWAALPDARSSPREQVPFVAGLGLVRGAFLVPHWSGSLRWAVDPPAEVGLLGVPEHSAVLVDAQGCHPLGARPSVWVGATGQQQVLEPGVHLPWPPE